MKSRSAGGKATMTEGHADSQPEFFLYIYSYKYCGYDLVFRDIFCTVIISETHGTMQRWYQERGRYAVAQICKLYVAQRLGCKLGKLSSPPDHVGYNSVLIITQRNWNMAGTLSSTSVPFINAVSDRVGIVQPGHVSDIVSVTIPPWACKSSWNWRTMVLQWAVNW